MDAADFFHDVAKANWEEFPRQKSDLRLLWNAVVSMNTVAEWVALARLGYAPSVSRDMLYSKAQAIRDQHQSLIDLAYCANTFKHVRKIPGSSTDPFSITASSTAAVFGDPTTWIIAQPDPAKPPHDLVKVAEEAIATLSQFPELVR